MAVTLDVLQREWQEKKFRPLYVFGGDEPFFMDQAMDTLSTVTLEEHERDFNLTVLYGRDTDAATIMSEAKRFPMMAERTVVLVKEAQQIKDIEALASYVAQVQPSTVLALALKGKKLDKRKALYKALQKHDGVYLEFTKLYDNQVPPWVESQAQRMGLKMSGKAAALLGEYIGADLSRIHHELEKIQAFVGQGGEVTAKIIEERTGISREFNTFELIKALAAKDIAQSYRIAKSMGENPKNNPVVVTLSLLFGNFSKALVYGALPDKNPRTAAAALKISEFALRDVARIAQNYPPSKLLRILGYLREADRQAKGMGAPHINDSDILHELLFKILY